MLAVHNSPDPRYDARSTTKVLYDLISCIKGK